MGWIIIIVAIILVLWSMNIEKKKTIKNNEIERRKAESFDKINGEGSYQLEVQRKKEEFQKNQEEIQRKKEVRQEEIQRTKEVVQKNYEIAKNRERNEIAIARDKNSAMLKMNNIAHCPKCSSPSVAPMKKGYSVGKAVVGVVLTGGIGLVGGAIGANKVQMVCMNCGHKYKPS